MLLQKVTIYDSIEAIIPQKFDAYSFGVTLAEILFNAYGCKLNHYIISNESDVEKLLEIY